jgi:hypothetical protein
MGHFGAVPFPREALGRREHTQKFTNSIVFVENTPPVIAMTTPSPTHAPCPECGSALAADQRYCLQCGARRGLPRVDHLREVGVHERPRTAAGLEPAEHPRRWAWSLSRRRGLWTAGVAAIAGGVVVGWLSGPAPTASSAPGPSRIVLLDAPVSAATVAPTPTPTPTPTESPKPEPTDTPTPEPTAASTPKPAATATATTAPDDDDQAPLAASTPAATSTPAPAPAIKHVWLVRVADLAAGAPAALAPTAAILTGFSPADTAGTVLLAGQDAAASYAADVLTLPGQLAAAGSTWTAYVADPTQGCPAPLNAFRSLEGACTVAPLTALATDAAGAFAYVVLPDDATLQALLASPGYADGGLVVIVSGGTSAELLSPLAKAGARVTAADGPAALLRTLEDGFGLLHLGHAADADVAPLGADVFPTSTPTP